MGDCELVTTVAPMLAAKLPEADYLLTAEAKGIPLVHELCRVLQKPYYIVARKSVKPYMDDAVIHTVTSITSQKEQLVCLDGRDARLIKGKKVIIVDDVISTGASLKALEDLAAECGAEVVAKAAILAEGDSAQRNDIIFLAKLPVFDGHTMCEKN